MSKARRPDERARIRERIEELLAELEHEVRRDGADGELLAAVQRERQEISSE